MARAPGNFGSIPAQTTPGPSTNRTASPEEVQRQPGSTPPVQPQGYPGNKAARNDLISKSDDLAAPPDPFDKDKMYRIRLSRSVSVHEGAPDAHILRPSEDVVVSGEFAQSIREHILGAVVVEQ